MIKILLATTNKEKVREIKEILKTLPFEVVSLEDIPQKIEIIENGKTFKENAVIKAKIAGEQTGILTIGEDSGLEVDALGGRPGIYSARYCQGSDDDRNKRLLWELKGTPNEKRSARYKAVVALYIPKSHSGKRSASRIDSGQARMTEYGKIFTFEGVSEGYIIEKPVGTNGFGYDPIFFNNDLGMTNGEASFQEKNNSSHRGRALEQLKLYLSGQWK